MARVLEIARTVPERVYHTVILSDLHLGSAISRAEDARLLLERLAFRKLILLGDIFCDLNFARLKREHWELLSYIRKLSNPKRNVEVVWVEGNHDRGLTEVMSHLVGVRVYKEYSWRFLNRRYLAIHGHQFDRFLVNNGALSAIGAYLYIHLQRFDSNRHGLSHFLDRQNSKWLRLSPKVESGAIAYAKLRGADVVFCGHTHLPLETVRDGVCYFNSGCWTNQTPSYITVDESGTHICNYVGDELGSDVNSAVAVDPSVLA